MQESSHKCIDQAKSLNTPVVAQPAHMIFKSLSNPNKEPITIPIT